MFFKNLQNIALTDPDRPALMYEDSTYTYKELWDRSVAIAEYLIKYSSLECPVAVIGDKENDMVAAMFGAILIGKTYVVIPSFYPKEKMRFILLDSESDFIINLSDIDFTAFNLPIINSLTIDQSLNTDNTEFITNLPEINENDTAVLLYTSGSTGEPKGVMISYANLRARIERVKYEYRNVPMGKTFRHSCFVSYAFCATYSFLHTFDEEGCFYICVSKKNLTDYKTLFSYLCEVQPGGLLLTPSLIDKLLSIDDFNSNVLTGLSLITLGAEAVSIDLYKQIKERFPDIYLSNGYGLTECLAVGMCFFANDDNIDWSENLLPIGTVDDAPVFLIDYDGNRITEENVPGEIVIYGNMVSKGYYKQPELTKEVYYTLEDGTRAFKTHDLAVMRNGRYYFIGRKDHQLKIGGNRVELSDAEANLKKCTIVQDCAIGIRKNPETSMTAFVILNDEGKALKRAEAFLLIKKELKDFVESFMIPRKIIFLDELPRNLNSKIDRTLLNQWAQDSVNVKAEFWAH